MTDLPISARLGANVRRYRRERGMPLRRLSEMLHDVGLALSVSGLSRLEHGDRPVTVDELVLIADVLDVAPVDLLEERTVVTSTGGLRMELHERRDVEDEAPTGAPVEPAPVLDPRLLEVLASLAIGAELRALVDAVAATTVTRSQTDQLRLLTSAVSQSLGDGFADQVRALGRVAADAALRGASQPHGDAVHRAGDLTHSP